MDQTSPSCAAAPQVEVQVQPDGARDYAGAGRPGHLRRSAPHGPDQGVREPEASEPDDAYPSAERKDETDGVVLWLVAVVAATL